ncbi:Alpha-ketoglutarate-dependent taurine dioxygenase (plasmid) [Variovorax sp. SRS16]|uniref:TauD/TfdA dioxygenase family protein n=1 Tax=Variovorax sp. SRS16 TaxID=282217 RepID=UPI0013169AEA|nr:TauD/TfdA family dioxygenase [Variovorax sp. SRS16]VTU45615.1 Alpha-ketoglutarate-dependent taurine dioxygenase [Variovorax sp. SRS16]
MALQVRPLAPAVGAEIVDFDLSKDFGDDDFAQIESVFNERGLLLFRKQHLSEQRHIEISQRFGKLQDHVLKPFLIPGYEQTLRITNLLDDEGEPLGIGDAGLFWHSDTSYTQNPCRCSLLYSIEVPAREGERSYGDTLFASLTAAYEALDEATKAQIADLCSEHSYGKHYARMQAAGSKRPDLTEAQKREVPKVVHPLVRPHPITREKALFVNDGYTTHIIGMEERQSDALLKKLVDQTTRPEFTYRHRWNEGDLLIWDNSSTQHLAIADYALPQRRLMHRTTVLAV